MASHPLLIHNYYCNILPHERNVNPGKEKKVIILNIILILARYPVNTMLLLVCVQGMGIVFFSISGLFRVPSPNSPENGRKCTEIVFEALFCLILLGFGEQFKCFPVADTLLDGVRSSAVRMNLIDVPSLLK